MPPKKRLRSTSSLLGDLQQSESQSTAQDEGFQALYDHEPPQNPADEVEISIGESSGSDGVGMHIGDLDQDLVDSNDGEQGMGGSFFPEQQVLTEHDDVAMVDEPTSDGSTPWLDYLHNNGNPYSPDLPFGLQLAHTSSHSTNTMYDSATSDEDAGGVSLFTQPSTLEAHPGGWDIQQLNNLSFSSPEQHISFDPPTEAEPQSTGQYPTHTQSTAGYIPPQPALPFGIMALPTTYPQTGLPGIDHIAEDTQHGTTASQPAIDFLPDEFPPLMPSSTNYMILGSENVGLVDFLRLWAHTEVPRNPVPDINQIRSQATKVVKEVTYDDLYGEYCDLQGLNWAAMGIPRTAARTHRHKTYKNYVNKEGSDSWSVSYDGQVSYPQANAGQGERREKWVNNTENYFRFRKTVIRPDVNLAHFQLRSVLATPSRVQAFYPTSKGIYRLNPLTRKTELVFDLGEFSALNRAITTLDAACGVLVAGTFGGDYIIKSLQTQSVKNHSEGTITNPMCGITNHLQVHAQRECGSPVAAISSNDRGFRVLDIETEQFISDFMYHFPLNCSAVSPDKRLRVLVGDTKDVSITNVETGETEVELAGHNDYGFSCDWADDGFTVATGFQDKSVKIWDARKWTNSNREPTPLSVWCDMAGARNLKFSPLGSGEQVLVSAEEADYINIFDAKRGNPNDIDDFDNPSGFRSKQTIDIFGEIGGISFGDEGHELNVLISDPNRGGLIQFERATLGSRKPTMIEQVPIF